MDLEYRRFSLGLQFGVLIYDKVLEIKAEKTDGRVYYHKFTTKARVWGLEKGQILIASESDIHLWSRFAKTVDELKAK